VDKYEYNIKADQIMKLIDRRDFKTAAKIADGIDWRRVRNINMLTNIGCVYQAVGRYTDAKEIFQLARNRAPLGRRLVYQMADVCIDAGEFEEAERYIQEFSELAPKDTGRFELLYQLSRRKGEPIENQIAVLEEFKKQDFDARWAYELAKLYRKAGYSQKCIEACDELILWFGEGPYVDKAMELKMLYVPLSPSQQEKYDARFKKKQEEAALLAAKEEKQKEQSAFEHHSIDYRQDAYSTENLQAALAKSMQKIMEEEERQKALYPSSSSYLEEYQTEQEEKEAMFAATRDLRKEREKFKMFQPIDTFDLSSAATMENIAPEPANQELGEQLEDTQELDKSSYEMTEENQIEEPFKDTLHREEYPQFEQDFSEEEEEEKEIYWSSPEQSIEETDEEEQIDAPEETSKGEFFVKSAIEKWKEPLSEAAQEERKEEGSEEEKEENYNEEYREEYNEYREERGEYNKYGEEKEEYNGEEEQEAESEYEEVPFSLEELRTNEIPAEIYYGVPQYDPQGYLNKAAVHSINFRYETKEEQKEENIDKIEKESIDKIEEEQNKEETKRIDPIKNLPEDYFEKFEEIVSSKETEEEFYQTMVSRSYGIEEVPDHFIYQVPGEIEKIYEEEQESVETDDQGEDSEYLYGVEELPKDACYVVAGYDPEGYLSTVLSELSLEEELIPPSPQPMKKQEQKPKMQPAKTEVQKEIQKNEEENKAKAKQAKRPKKADGMTLELTPEYKNVFANYLQLPGMEQQIAELLYEMEQIGSEQENSVYGNILVMGEVKSGKTRLAVSLIRTVNHLNGRKGRKIAKISGDRMNNKGIKESINRLIGADLIIEHAGEMKVSTIQELLKAMKGYTGGMIVVLEDTRGSIERLLADVPKIKNYFTHQVELKECNIGEWAEAAKKYAEEENYMIDEMAMLALSAKIDSVYAEKKNVTIEDVKEIIDTAAQRAQKRNRKFFGRLFSKKKNTGVISIRESDFD